jgi:hypothetical protein
MYQPEWAQQPRDLIEEIAQSYTSYGWGNLHDKKVFLSICSPNYTSSLIEYKSRVKRRHHFDRRQYPNPVPKPVLHECVKPFAQSCHP